MKKLLPIIMLLIGSGAGVGAGIFMRPPPTAVDQENAMIDPIGSEQELDEVEASANIPGAASSAEGMEYVKLPNQFVVPLVEKDRISAMVVMALSVEVAAGASTEVIDKEPKLRDEFLRVLFDYATIGGFSGSFINNENLDVLRSDLREAAKRVMGSDVANDVLIFEIARQDY
ncbi:MAG: flagellar basal body-associated FliL family protein [Paracoccaceae bacterium]|nr:flagellar basal body-associated FliL family protein [Paracoccaceae bacterium]